MVSSGIAPANHVERVAVVSKATRLAVERSTDHRLILGVPATMPVTESTFTRSPRTERIKRADVGGLAPQVVTVVAAVPRRVSCDQVTGPCSRTGPVATVDWGRFPGLASGRSEEHTSELQS